MDARNRRVIHGSVEGMASGRGCPGTEAKAVQIGGSGLPDWTGPVKLDRSSRDVVHCTGFSRRGGDR
jgi:hypothetical protein